MCLDCNDKKVIGRIGVEASGGVNINVVGVDPIRVSKTVSGTDVTFTVSYVPYSLPTAKILVSPRYVEIGEDVGVTYTATWGKGSDDIASVTINDVEVTGSSPNISYLSVNEYTIGSYGSKTIKVVDVKGGEAEDTVDVKVQHRYYIGSLGRFSALPQLGSGLVSGSITQAYGDLRSYVLPEVDSYLVWLFPQGESMGEVRDSNGFLCETVDGGLMTITNMYGVTIVYQVVRSKNYYVAGSTLSLKF